jgi:hypothetical protein
MAMPSLGVGRFCATVARSSGGIFSVFIYAHPAWLGEVSFVEILIWVFLLQYVSLVLDKNLHLAKLPH